MTAEQALCVVWGISAIFVTIMALALADDPYCRTKGEILKATLVPIVLFMVLTTPIVWWGL